jgi:hypothetical protein
VTIFFAIRNQRAPLQQPDFRPQPIESQLNLRHARQLIVQLDVNRVDLSADSSQP